MWDTIITLIILIVLALAVWAKVSKQTIPQLLEDLKDKLLDKKEEVQDMGVDIYD